MKKISKIIVLFLVIPSFIVSKSCHTQATSKTALSNSQAPFSSVSPELVAGFRNDRTYAHNDIRHGAVQFALFGSQSTHATKNDLASYFFPGGKTCLSCADDDLFDNFEKKKDLLAQNFNVFTKNGDFRSEISIAPTQSVVGCGIHWRQCFLRDPLKGEGLWVSVSVPLVQVRNRMNLEEYVSNDGGGPDESVGVPVVGTMKEAFVQPEWLFGKICDGVMTKTALADIELKVGYDQYLSDEPSHMELYAGVIIPTSNKNKGEFVFEPIVGRGHHAGLMLGGELGKDVWVRYGKEQKITWELAVHGEYLFKNKQVRSFDLVDKPWSRYIPLYANEEQAQEAADLILIDRARAQNLATPGINVLTQRVSVVSGLSYDMNSAFVFQDNRIRAELGYNLFFKRAECVTLACPWQPVVAIKYTDGAGKTNPIRDIAGNKYLEQDVFDNSGGPLIPVALADFNQSVIVESDLDLLSASTPALFSHTIYGSVGAYFDEKKYPVIVDGGISYTFSENNAVVKRWMMWLKSGLSF
jgi:hypothetical protein